ncbi:MAG: hypothetical protein H6767_02135 [Candidatus Peribacteria bacterium]|nr:MAG: hypothetical protein H6767_02135 [Candidatus Peribacteria bacterium]
MNEDYGEMLPPHIPSGVDYTKLSPTEVAIESIKVSVHEWIEKYHPRYGDSNLLVTDPTDKHQLLQWRD